MAADSLLQGLAPVIREDCRVLVLGSMPGAASLSQQQYYAHPRNRFWPLMAELCGFDAALPYGDRLLALQAARVGLWDVIGACEREGSLDAAIIPGSEVANPIHEYVCRLPALRAVALNGGKAAQAFERHVRPQLPLETRERLMLLRLPSTSPANALFNAARLRQAWGMLGDVLRAP